LGWTSLVGPLGPVEGVVLVDGLDVAVESEPDGTVELPQHDHASGAKDATHKMDILDALIGLALTQTWVDRPRQYRTESNQRASFPSGQHGRRLMAGIGTSSVCRCGATSRRLRRWACPILAIRRLKDLPDFVNQRREMQFNDMIQHVT
jgi:hypothetical protein